jgi:hypothetical protein
VNLNVGDKFEADGTVRVGASFTPDVPPFKGKIGCLLFQKGYYLKNNILIRNNAGLSERTYCLNYPLTILNSIKNIYIDSGGLVVSD